MQLICVRHGRTAWNAGRRFQGHTDVPLDDEGRAQAIALAALLRGETIDAAVSSDLSRAQETARAVIGSRDVPLRIDPDWREMRFGDWEGQTWAEIRARTPDLDERGETVVRTYRAPNGETFTELRARVGHAVERIVAELRPGGTALVATHAGPLHALLEVLLAEADRPAFNVRFAPASVTRFRRRDGRWTLVRLNETMSSPEAPREGR